MKRLIVIAILAAFGGLAVATMRIRSIDSEGTEPKRKIDGQKVEVRDARDQRVGEFVQLAQVAVGAIVTARVEDARAFLLISRERVEGSVDEFANVSATLFYESQDCSGQPYLPVTDMLTPATAVAPPGQTLYLGSSDGGREVVLGSIWRNGLPCEPSDGGVFAVPARPVARLDQLAPPPYRIVLKD